MIMDNQVNNTHTFINNNNFNNVNSLTHLLDTGEPEVKVANIKLSEYCDNTVIIFSVITSSFKSINVLTEVFILLLQYRLNKNLIMRSCEKLGLSL